MTAPVPKYMQVAEDIRQQIRTGQLNPGDRLPSTTQLVEHYRTKLGRMSYGTLRDALRELKQEGLIEGRPGDGVYVLSKPRE
jgi:DNA-binding GntR family transcriptional regulator